MMYNPYITDSSAGLCSSPRDNGRSTNTMAPQSDNRMQLYSSKPDNSTSARAGKLAAV